MTIFKIKENKIEIFKDWANKISTELCDKAIESLKEENCTHEIFNYFEIDGRFYVVAHMEGGEYITSKS